MATIQNKNPKQNLGSSNDGNVLNGGIMVANNLSNDGTSFHPPTNMGRQNANRSNQMGSDSPSSSSSLQNSNGIIILYTIDISNYIKLLCC